VTGVKSVQVSQADGMADVTAIVTFDDALGSVANFLSGRGIAAAAA